MSPENRSHSKIDKFIGRDKEIANQMNEDPGGELPEVPPGAEAPPVEEQDRVFSGDPTRKLKKLHEAEPMPELSDPKLSTVEVEEAERDSDIWLEEQWRRQRQANLAHGIISPRDSKVYKRTIKRDIDGDPILSGPDGEENLRQLKAVESIMPRPQGWLPANVRSVFPRLPSFVRRLMEKVSAKPLDKEKV